MCFKLPTSEVVDYAVCKVDKQFLYPIGSGIDILCDTTNPAKWMAHGHIEEHLTLGMMMTFNIDY